MTKVKVYRSVAPRRSQFRRSGCRVMNLYGGTVEDDVLSIVKVDRSFGSSCWSDTLVCTPPRASRRCSRRKERI